MSWQKIEKIGVALYDFTPQQDQENLQIQLKINDKVMVIEEASGWYRGYLLDTKLTSSSLSILSGLFPATYVRLIAYEDETEDETLLRQKILNRRKQKLEKQKRNSKNKELKSESKNGEDIKAEALKKTAVGESPETNGKENDVENGNIVLEKSNDEILTIDVLKTEISTCLSKQSAQQHIYSESGDTRNYYLLKERTLSLLDLRRQLLADNTPEEVRTKLRSFIISHIESSRCLDDKYMVPRNQDGELALPSNTSLIDLMLLHQKMDEDFSMTHEQSRSFSPSVIKTITGIGDSTTGDGLGTGARTVTGTGTRVGPIGTNTNTAIRTPNTSTTLVQQIPFLHFSSKFIAPQNPTSTTQQLKHDISSPMLKHSESQRSISGAGATGAGVSANAGFAPGNYQLRVDVTAAIFRVNEPVTLHFSLQKQDGYVTEEFIVKLDENGSLQPPSLSQSSLSTIFKDLKAKDFENDGLYIVCRIYRYGALHLAVDSGKKKRLAITPTSSTTTTPSTSQNSYNKIRRPFGCACMSISNIGLQKMLGKRYDSPAKIMKIYKYSNEADFPHLHKLIKRSDIIDQVRDSIGIGLGLTLFYGNYDALSYSDTACLTRDRDNKGRFSRSNSSCPSFEASIPVTKRFLGSDIISPTEIRNDVYISILKCKIVQDVMRFYVGEKVKTISKKQSKNIQIEFRVLRNSTGELVKNAIFLGSSYGGDSNGMESYFSTVYYHMNVVDYDETFRISVPSSVLYDSHIFFLIRHISSSQDGATMSPFSFGFLNLIDSKGVMIPDGTYECHLYNSFPRMTQQHDISYLALSDYNTKSTTYIQRKDCVTLRTRLCSSKNVQNETLFELYNWSEKQNIEMYLEQFLKLPGSVIIRHLREILDTLLKILISFSKTSQRVFISFHCILYLCHEIVEHPEQIQYLELFLQKIYHNTKAQQLFMEFSHQVFDFVIQNYDKDKKQQSDDSKASTNLSIIRLLSKTCKYHLKFAVLSRQKERCSGGSVCLIGKRESNTNTNKNGAVEGESNGETNIHSNNVDTLKNDVEFKKYVMEMLKDMNRFLALKRSDNLLINCKAFLMMNFESMFVKDLLLLLFNHQQLGLIVKNFIESLPSDEEKSYKLYLDKYTMIYKLVSGTIGRQLESRKIILSLTVSNLKQGLLKIKNNDFDGPYMCISILVKLLQILQRDAYTYEDVWVFCGLIPELVFFVYAIISNKHFDTGIYTIDSFRSAFMCLMTILQLQNDQAYDNLLECIPTSSRKTFIDKLMRINLQALDLDLFHEMWIVMLMAQRCITAQLLARISKTILRSWFSNDNFDYQIWKDYFELGISLLTSKVLQFLPDSESRNQFILNNYGDIRIDIRKNLTMMQDSLELRQFQFTQFIIPKVFSLTSCGQGVEKLGMHIYYDILACEYKESETFRDVESFTIDTLQGITMKSRHKSDLFIDNLISIVGKKLRENSDLCKAGKVFIEHIENLYKMMCDLLDISKKGGFEHERTELSLKLMDYLENSVHIRKEMFYTYVQDLADMHIDFGNYVEAGITQLDHIKMIHWNDEVVPRIGRFDESTERRRKEQLYKLCIEYFNKGQDYERCIEMCNELQKYYKYHLADYKQLSETLKREAQFYLNIISNSRVYPYFYRVVFIGDFDEGLLNKEQIYRGKPLEQVRDFADNILKDYHDAKIIMSVDSVSDEDRLKHSKIVTVRPVLPSTPNQMYETRSPPHPLDSFRSFEIKNYYRNNEICVFNYSKAVQKSKEKKPDNEFKELWALRTFMKTEIKFPSNRRRAPVIDTKEIQIHPIRNAIEAIRDKTEEFYSIALKIKDSTPNVDINNLSMNLQGTIDAAVSGGTKLYVEAFLTPEYLVENPDQFDNVTSLKKALLTQQNRLKEGLDIFGMHCDQTYVGLYNHLKDFWAKMAKANESVLKMDIKQK